MTDQTAPGADELRIRGHLRRLLDPPPPNMPPGPPPDPGQPPRDWLDDILNGNASPPRPAPPPPPGGPVPLPGPVAKQPVVKAPKKPSRQRPAYRKPAQPAPRKSLADAWDNTPPRLRWLAYHATAATAGWSLGWVDWATDTAAWYAAGHWLSPSGFVLYGLGCCVLALYRRARAWAWPFAWAAAIPVSSVVVGVLLYGTGYQP
ncbi:hypothetical protein [Streptomyces sp. AMCC400023]|uniref:hypothetical protein n=1 Tax=Streptomyces sp. AMCC400023 TaxID=2056258 RepID=UPI001F2BF453|nr:hypothetical protein [Streptomyces sp. AMCC400023]UJV42059.1 hypothetical protein CVT30_21395 [Streptomyces sp. AMCC400023]